jgi:D-glycero-alpha-D-manno-heptose-7-phosphate kinase
MQTSNSGSVRVDLLGGTLDLTPIDLSLQNSWTINFATSLQAQVEVESLNESVVRLVSEDYNETKEFSFKQITENSVLSGNFFEHYQFIIGLCWEFKDFWKSGFQLKLKSGSPPGAGLGGSSAMGVVCFQALAQFFGKTYSADQILLTVKDIEARILDSGPTGFQDYYPALYGGVLALKRRAGRVEVKQLFTKDLQAFLQDNLTLVFSGIKRLSGINNWQVYKRFYDQDTEVRQGLSTIADLSHKALQAIEGKRYDELLKLIVEEGQYREELFSGIVPEEIKNFQKKLEAQSLPSGIKMCGAGGGGCFLIGHRIDQKEKIHQVVQEEGMKVLDFQVSPPKEIQ